MLYISNLAAQAQLPMNGGIFVLCGKSIPRPGVWLIDPTQQLMVNNAPYLSLK
ncbi:hypothetical protein ALT721_1740018 [Alteromonas alvinellae]